MSARLQHYESEESKYKAMLHQLQSLLRYKTEHTRELDAQLAAQRDVTERVETLKTEFEGELRAVTETAQQTGRCIGTYTKSSQDLVRRKSVWSLSIEIYRTSMNCGYVMGTRSRLAL
eukprot:GILJ01005953.1.p1 GENE.GILJ01005953.1~~GILJ01005953.1.p1  ORF type:complete len:118 (+),score=8.05 GILJ01005953.1:500-853(+)